MGYDITLGLLSQQTIDEVTDQLESERVNLDTYSDRELTEYMREGINELKSSLSASSDFAQDSGFILATMFQSLDESWYMRGNYYSGLFAQEEIVRWLQEKEKSMSQYLSSWNEFLPENYHSGDNQSLDSNYAVGCIASYGKLQTFLEDYKNDNEFHRRVNGYFGHNIYPFLVAALTAVEQEKSLFEAEGLVLPSLSFENPPSYLYTLKHCDGTGKTLFFYVTQYQIAAAKGAEEDIVKTRNEFAEIVNMCQRNMSNHFGDIIPEFTPENGFTNDRLSVPVQET